ncbi:MAG: hypothetical protein ACJ790_07930 [Myxococcaceae bacterium]
MTIDFTCRKCDASFELDVADLIDGSEKLQCPNCDAKATTTMVEDFTAALTELRTQVTALSKKFAVNLAVETEDLEEETEEEEDAAEEEEADDDELDFDEDDDEDVDDDDEDVDEDVG